MRILKSVTIGISSLALAIGVLAAQVQASPILHEENTKYGEQVAEGLYNAYVAFPSGIYATGDSWPTKETTLTWDITFDQQTGTWQYQYTWHTTADAKDMSNITIELTENTKISTISLPDPIMDKYEIGNFTPDPKKTPGMPGAIYGIKVEPYSDGGDYTFSFITDQAPVWGNFYAKDGKVAIYAYNTAFANPDQGVFIARPDGAPVPEPATIILLGSGLLGMGLWGRRKFRR